MVFVPTVYAPRPKSRSVEVLSCLQGNTGRCDVTEGGRCLNFSHYFESCCAIRRARPGWANKPCPNRFMTPPLLPGSLTPTPWPDCLTDATVPGTTPNTHLSLRCFVPSGAQLFTKPLASTLNPPPPPPRPVLRVYFDDHCPYERGRTQDGQSLTLFSLEIVWSNAAAFLGRSYGSCACTLRRLSRPLKGIRRWPFRSVSSPRFT